MFDTAVLNQPMIRYSGFKPKGIFSPPIQISFHDIRTQILRRVPLIWQASNISRRIHLLNIP